MPDVALDKPIVLDLLPDTSPALSAVSDMPVIETKPDATPDKKPAAEPETPAAPASEEASTTTSESATEHTDEQPGEPGAGKPARGVQKRLDELAKQREEANRRADAGETERLRLLALLEQATKPAAEKPAVTTDEGPTRPQRATFADDATYEAALDDYIVQKSAAIAQKTVNEQLAEQGRKAQEQAIAQGQEQARAAYNERVTKALEKHPDYKEVAESQDVMVSVAMAHAITHDEAGPEIAYYLGKNPTEAERISKLTPPQQIMELGRISAKLAAPADPKPKPVSAAPEPGKPIRASETTVKSLEELPMEEYAALRKKEMAGSRLRH